MAQEPKKVSRRQAIKLITATAGAATLANLPNKWVKPALQAGVLPAHAQTSPTATPPATATPIPHTFVSCSVEALNGQVPGEFYPWDTLVMSATITPAAAGIQIRRTISIDDGSLPNDVETGPTDASGVYAGPNFILEDWGDTTGHDVTILWEFVNAADGTETCSRTITVQTPN